MSNRTPLYDAHLAAGARMVPFAGWEMPVQYTGVIDEVRAVRHAAGVFDVSHMGEALVTGPGALAWLNSYTTNDVSRLSPGRAQYSLLLNPEGGILDDILVYQLGEERYLLVLNASNTAKDLAWLEQHRTAGVELQDVSDETALLAVQGPEALPRLAPLASLDLADLRRFGCASGTIAGVPTLIARTGYTGEDGFELFIAPWASVNPSLVTCHSSLVTDLWSAALEAGVKPCGLGARDVLRLEAGNVLYGHEIDEQTNPLEAGLAWAVKLEKGAFMGSEALLERRKEEHGTNGPDLAAPPSRRLIGFVSESRAVPRQGYPIVRDGDTLGAVTSGTFSPTLERPIGMGYVPVAAAHEGELIQFIAHGRPEPARIVALPLYRGRR